MSSIIHAQVADIPYGMTTTTFDLAGYRVVETLGVVRGVVVRSRSVFGTIGAGLQTILGGNITLGLILGLDLEREGFGMRELRAAVEADIFLAGQGELDHQHGPCRPRRRVGGR